VNAFVRAVTLLSNACGIIAAICLAAACIVVCEMVVLRYGLNASTIWQTEFVTYAVAASTLVGSPYVLLKRGHVNVDLLPHYLGHTGRMIMALLASVLALLFCVVLTFSSWRYFHEAWSNGWATETVWAPPLWAVILPMPFGMTVLSLQYIVDIIELVRGRSPPFGMEPAPGMPFDKRPRPEELE